MKAAVPTVGVATRKSPASPVAVPNGVLKVMLVAPVLVNCTLTTALLTPTTVFGSIAGFGEAIGVTGVPAGGGENGGGGGGGAAPATYAAMSLICVGVRPAKTAMPPRFALIALLIAPALEAALNM